MREPRRFQVHFGQGDDGAGYVVADTHDKTTGDWRGKVVFKSDSRHEVEQEAIRLNEPKEA